MHYIDIKLGKFLLVGLINTLVGAGIMFILYNFAHFGYWLSSACNYIFGGLVSFFLNKYFTFRNHENSLTQIVLFILVLVISYVVAYLLAKQTIFHLLSFYNEKLRGNVSLFLGMCLYTILNYLGQRLIVFAEKENTNE